MKKMIILLLMGTIFLTACQVDDGEGPNRVDQDDKMKEEIGIEDNGTRDDLTPPDLFRKTKEIEVSVQEAFDLFKGEHANSKINEIEFELEDKRYEYKIEGYDGNMEYEVKIDAHTGEILEKDQEKKSGEYGDIKKEELDKVDKYINEAYQDAGSQYWLNEWTLKVEKDYVKFEIEFKDDGGNKLKYKYDYKTGDRLEKK